MDLGNKCTYTIFGLMLCITLIQCQNGQSQASQQDELSTASIRDIHENFDGYHGIEILNEGPTGSRFTNSKRGEFGVLIFRIRIFNDTIVPIDLELEFPSNPVPLLPDSLTKVEVYVLPDSMTPDTIQKAFNFGVTGIAEYFDADFTAPGSLKMRIQPHDHHTLYLGMIAETTMDFGTFRTELFLNGQDIDAPFLPVTSIKREQKDSGSLDLIYGVGFTPHRQYTLIPCGQIHFLK